MPVVAVHGVTCCSITCPFSAVAFEFAFVDPFSAILEKVDS